MKTSFTIKQWLALSGISLLGFTCFLDVTIVSNALPAIRNSLVASDTQLQWLVNTIYVALCALMATIGRMGDVFGLRKVMYTSMTVMAIASFICGISTNIQELIFFRAVQGVSLASITMTAALVSHNFSVQEQPKAMSIFSAGAGLGLALGPVIGGFLVDLLSWRWIFFINVPIIAIGILICSFSVTEKRDHLHKQTIDWLGAGFLILCITSFITTLIQGQNWGWSSLAVAMGFGIAIVTAIGFVITERKVTTPLMPFPLLANSIFLSAALTCGTCGAFIAVLLFFNPLYLQTILHYSATLSGWILLSSSLAYILMSPVAGYITNRFSPKTGTWVVCVLLMLSALFHTQFGVESHLGIIILGLVFFGLGWGAVNVSPVVAVMQTASPANTGILLGCLWTIFNLGSALVLSLVGILFRFIEFRFLLANLVPFEHHFSTTEAELLQRLIIEPEQSAQIVSQFPSDIASHIMPAYTQAFVQGFNDAAWILLGLATISFLVVFFFMKRKS